MSAATTLRPICETRIGKPDDLAFVVDCWTKKLGRDEGMPHARATRRVRTLLGVLDRALYELPSQLSRLLIAHVPGDVDAILGWACVEAGRPALWPEGTPKIVDRNVINTPACVHYIYVRSAARRQGIARALVGSPEIALEYSTRAPSGFVVPPTWVLNLERARV